jgi:hypothetical protein
VGDRARLESAKALGISLGPQGVTVKTTGLDGTYIDYFNTVHGFGIRVLEDCCFVVIQIADGQPVFGHPHQIPLQLEIVPSHVRLIVDDHLMNYPTSDLMDVLTGKKSFLEALDSPAEIKGKRITSERFKHAS